MDTIDIPLFKGAKATISEAIESLERADKAGVLHDPSGHLYLILIGDLLTSQELGISHLRDVATRYPVYEVLRIDIHRFELNVSVPLSSSAAFGNLLGEDRLSNFDYLLTDRMDGIARIVTRHEELARMLYGRGFQCDGVVRHFFPSPKVSVGDNCPHYPGRCRTASGNPPRIQRRS